MEGAWRWPAQAQQAALGRPRSSHGWVSLLFLDQRPTLTTIVIRAEGVLRVILNANMYVGMTCLEDGKHVRTTVFEDGKTLFVTLRTSNPKVAAELASAIQDHIPLESARATASPSAADSAV